MPDLDAVRIDRWLWAARFFKTRGLAAEAVKKGRVAINGVKAKPAKKVSLGDQVALKKDRLLWQLEVTGLSERRLGAALAQGLYCEDAAGKKARENQQEQARLQAKTVRYDHKYGRGRPGKHDRRELIRAKHGE